MPEVKEFRKVNKLIHEKSPYLIQHAYNPVNWFPWNEEAFATAAAEDKPIFLSIGYSTCHWCHVMERESFEDEEVAQILNENFVAIKVDREERPDIDHIYMTVCQILTEHGGWPLTILMTPDKKPFFAGTYFPKGDRLGAPGLITLLERASTLWQQQKEKLLQSGRQIVAALNQSLDTTQQINAENLIKQAYLDLKNNFDANYGGFGTAPKFPTPHNLFFLLRYWFTTEDETALNMVEKTLESMYRGGIFDHLGFGFARYATDRKWLVPHFEKMLYDNALLAIAYAEAFLVTKKTLYAQTATQIFTYILREMTGDQGGFYSAEDADSEGIEGKFYLWSPAQIKEILGETVGEQFCRYYDITDKGNFEGNNIPNLLKQLPPKEEDVFLDECRQKLFNAREERVHPYKDDKILTSWNGLMIAALAIGGRCLNNSNYTLAAEKAVAFIDAKLRRKDGRLMARFRDGETAHPGYVNDYAFLIWGLIELYETTYKASYLQQAIALNDDLLALFWDDTDGGLFLYGNDSETLIARPKEIYDGATPSGNSVATLNFLRLARLTGNSQLEEKAQQQFQTFGGYLSNAPRGYTFFLTALLFANSPSKEVVLVGDEEAPEMHEMLATLRADFHPFTSSLLYSAANQDLETIAPFLKDYQKGPEAVEAYVCEKFACQSPISSPEDLREKLD